MTDETRLISPEAAKSIDHALRRRIAAATMGMSPIDLGVAAADWAGHLALSPGKILSLAESAARRSLEVSRVNWAALRGKKDALPAMADRRMQSERWQGWPFAVWAHAHQAAKAWTQELTTGVDGVSPQHEQLCRFFALQMVEAMSPANLPLTNPEVLAATREERGKNLARGVANFAKDQWRKRRGQPAEGLEDFVPGRQVATTPGRVVFRNELMELIQYAPKTETVAPEPVLLVPAWIMKYYILDLSPGNSLVRYLVEQGKTVFVISWKNPTAEDHHLGMDDYLFRGVLKALEVVETIVPDQKVHGVGYCLGGTLLAIAAAYLAREGEDRLKTLSLFAAQIDFRDAGEVKLFIAESTLSFLETLMKDRGYLAIDNMVGAFSALRVSDLVHEPAVQRYFLGKDRKLNDLMAWNSDGTRMPYRMHAEYLRRCYLDNDLAEARFEVQGRPISVGDIRAPAFVLGTSSDHVAPWPSVYKAVRLLRTDVTFALTNGGHNAGVACGADHPRRKVQLAHHRRDDTYRDPARWQAETEVHPGSWWVPWNAWLDARSGEPVPPPSLGAPDRGLPPLEPAPGTYVFG